MMVAFGTLWKYRKAFGIAFVVLVIAATHAWAYSAGVDAEENRIARERLAAFEQSYEQSIRVVAELLAEQREIDTTTQTVEREIVRYVPNDRACDLGPDVGRLLNDARNVSVPATR